VETEFKHLIKKELIIVLAGIDSDNWTATNLIMPIKTMLPLTHIGEQKKTYDYFSAVHGRNS
jgi:hypothetical protein